MSMRRFSVVEGIPSKPDGAGVIIGEGVVFDGESGGGRAVVMPADPSLGYPTFYVDVEHVTIERPNARVVFIDSDQVAPARGQLADLAAAPRREGGADPGVDVEP